MSNDQNNRIYDKLDKLDEKIDRKFEKIDKRMDSAERELVIYNEQLKFHIEGVRQIKTQNELLQKYIDMENEKMLEKIEPVIAHVTQMKSIGNVFKRCFQWFCYIVTVSGGIAGLVYSIMQITGKA